MNLSSNVIGDFNDGAHSPHKLLLTDTQVTRLPNAFANGSLANIKFSKTQLSKIIQSGGILADLLEAIPQAMFLTRVGALKKGVEKSVTLAKNAATKLAEKATESYAIKGINELDKNCTSSKGS